MRICKECADKRNMFSMMRVLAKCEFCGILDVCIDVHHSHVPVLATEGLDPYLQPGSVGYRDDDAKRTTSAETSSYCVMRGPKE